MNTLIESLHGMTLLLLQGRLDFGAAARFQAQVEAALAGGESQPRGLLIDCAGLDYVSSAGLRVFLIAARAATRAGIAFGVCDLKPSVREVFEISGFGALMAVHGDRSLALAQMPK